MSRHLIERVQGKVRRLLAEHISRRMVPIKPHAPIISFTFDDAPASAFRLGRKILGDHGARATFFVSLQLLGSLTEVGEIASAGDLELALEAGCELGCHTYNHLDAWRTPTETFMASVYRNKDALQQILPGAQFSSFAYPKSGAKLSVKAPLGRIFACCRGGGQKANVGSADLNLLGACFLDKRTGISLELTQKLIDHNAQQKGWLIFATHDVDQEPSPYGCTPDFLRTIVQYAQLSGGLLLPVKEAHATLLLPSS